MRDLQALALLTSKRLPTCIQVVDYAGSPRRGQFFLVGSIPYALTEPRNVGRWNEGRGSQFWPTLEACAAALQAAGVERYQLPDCSWNKPA